jgi:fission process protein 1
MWWGKSKDPKSEEKSNGAQIKDAVAEKLPSKEQISNKVQDSVNQTGKNGNVLNDMAEG